MSNLEKFGIQQGQGRFYEETIYSLALIYNICNTKMTNYLKKFNMTPGKFNILVAIKYHGRENGISQVEVSKHLIVTPSNMTKMIDKLEKEGMVTRCALPGDRRVNIINVTKKAADLIDRMWDEYTKELKSLLDMLPKKDQEILSSKMTKWLSMLLKEA